MASRRANAVSIMQFAQNLRSKPLNLTSAIALQKDLARRLLLTGAPDRPTLFGGVDCSSRSHSGWIIGAVVVWNRSENRIVDSATATVRTDFPYVPGFLAFRELPALLAAFERLKTLPEVVLCDGQGLAHPRGLGIACHLGLILDLPSVGCGKTRLVGSFTPPEDERGSQSILSYQSREVGRVLRTRASVAPVFVSPGHRCSFDEAVNLILMSCIRFRLPEPIRAAHHLSGRILAQIKDQEDKEP